MRGLTERQHAVVTALANGRTVTDIAAELGITGEMVRAIIDAAVVNLNPGKGRWTVDELVGHCLRGGHVHAAQDAGDWYGGAA